MPDAPKPESLNVAQEFPAVSTAEWEQVITKDLKGGDYDKKLVWRTEEGIAVRPYYRKENLAGLEDQLEMRCTKSDWEFGQDAQPKADAIRADFFYEAGAHSVQQLGYAVAAGVERLADLAAASRCRCRGC